MRGCADDWVLAIRSTWVRPDAGGISIAKARRLLGYEPTHSIERGLDESLAWYERTFG